MIGLRTEMECLAAVVALEIIADDVIPSAAVCQVLKRNRTIGLGTYLNLLQGSLGDAPANDLYDLP